MQLPETIGNRGQIDSVWWTRAYYSLGNHRINDRVLDSRYCHVKPILVAQQPDVSQYSAIWGSKWRVMPKIRALSTRSRCYDVRVSSTFIIFHCEYHGESIADI